MRRPVTDTVYCAEKGCTERPAYYEYSSQRERAEAQGDRRKTPYRCSRHLRPEQVLSVENSERTMVRIAQRASGVKDPTKLFWDGQSGFDFGPGFKAYASDFPEGTRLVITARIELPCTCNGGWSVDENYQPEDYEASEPLRPEKGLIPCGLCNHGGWDAPWPPVAAQPPSSEASPQ